MQELLAGGTALGRVAGAGQVADVQNLFRTSQKEYTASRNPETSYLLVEEK